MERQSGMKLFTFIISMLLVCALCFAAFAESADSDIENNGTSPEPDVIVIHTEDGDITVPAEPKQKCPDLLNLMVKPWCAITVLMKK